MADNQPYRVLELLKRFNNNQKVCISVLSLEPLWEGKSEKTIRRDLDIIKKAFPDSFHPVKGESGCYKAITTDTYNHLTNSENLALLVQIFKLARATNMLDELKISKIEKTIIEREIEKAERSYLFISKPYENNLSDLTLLNKLEKAVRNQYYLSIDYRGPLGMEPFEVKPYKIVFINEVFYLACEVENKDFIFTLLRISNIVTATASSKTFHKNYDLEDFIKNIQTSFSKYTPEYKKHQILIILEIHSSKARYFEAKKYLASQVIIEKKVDGTLIVSYTVTQESEIQDLIKKWIPFVKILEPHSLKEDIEDILQKSIEYL